jgi:L-ascorbate metabolism protein UlaG (beta-lactamase superfamily)
MRVRWLGWAGLELTTDNGEIVVVDPLEDATAVFTPLGLSEEEIHPPAITAPTARGTAVAGLVTHLHRDHADAGALGGALAPGAPVLGPPAPTGDKVENLGLAQAQHELAAAGLQLQPTEPWSSRALGSFTLTALPAVDGTGDPQVSWLIEADGQRVLHLGDTMPHGHWWRMARRHGPFDLVAVPVNGARLNFPHRQPPTRMPGALDPEQAAAATAALRAAAALPIHFGGYELPDVYEPVPDAVDRFTAALPSAVTVCRLGVGEEVEVAALDAPGAATGVEL